MTYTLSEAQKAIWHQQLGEQPRGTQRDLARALARKVKGKESAWATPMTNFFKGDDGGLRAVFDHPERLKVVAEGLGLSPRQLRDKLALAQGIPPEDALDEMRVPGFEDLGPRPILEAFYPPAHRETQFHLPGHSAATHTSSGGQVNLDELTRAAANSVGCSARSVATMSASVSWSRSEDVNSLRSRSGIRNIMATCFGRRVNYRRYARPALLQFLPRTLLEIAQAHYHCPHETT